MSEKEPNFNNQEDAPEDIEKRFKTERIKEATNEDIERSYKLDSLCYPKDMMAPKEEYESVFNDSTGVHVALKEDQNFCGHILSYDFSEEYEEAKEDDPELKKINPGEALYIYSIAIRPKEEGSESVRSIEALRVLWNGFKQEAVNDGYKKIIAYVRVKNGLSDILQKKCEAKFFRRKENWLEMQEPFDYLEIDLQKESEK